jgi:SAM-dependent methyltransferase
MRHGKAEHWQAVYRSREPSEVSWFAPHLNISIELLKRAGLTPATRLIDIGAGASTLLDDLLELGLRHLTAVDISAAALEVAEHRLGARAGHVRWLVADAANLDLPPLSYDLWHDRAALHFLIDPTDAAAYAASAARAVVEGGFAVIGGFAKDGPEQCSGLSVVRREPDEVVQLFGPAFDFVHSQHERHITPWGAPQSFAFTLLRKVRSG